MEITDFGGYDDDDGAEFFEESSLDKPIKNIKWNLLTLVVMMMTTAQNFLKKVVWTSLSRRHEIALTCFTNYLILKSNVGHQLLLKMGWKLGQGLGLDGSGIVEPIRLGEQLGKLGLGRGEKEAEVLLE
eukprot:Awhi_evm1s76